MRNASTPDDLWIIISLKKKTQQAVITKSQLYSSTMLF